MPCMSPIFNRENSIACGTLEIIHQTNNDAFQYGLVEALKPLQQGKDRKLQIIILYRCIFLLIIFNKVNIY